MQLDYKKFIIDLVENVGCSNFDVRGIESIGNPSFKDAVRDTSAKFMLQGIGDDGDGVLMVSPENFPNIVGRATYNSEQACSLLSKKNARVVLRPIFSGEFSGLSYAIWRKHKPLSNFRLLRLLQKKWLEPRVLEWLIGVATDTVRNLNENSIDEKIRAPIECLSSNFKMSKEVLDSAELAMRWLISRQSEPICVLQHSDFWLGNILLLNSGRDTNKYGFCVIDWGGSIEKGAPVFDLVRYCISAGISQPIARKYLLEYANSIGVQNNELRHYLLCGLGKIGLNLEQFPEDRFIKMCNDNITYINSLKLGD